MQMDIVTDPIELFQAWLEEARVHEPINPDAMAVATVDDAGCPDVRYLLLKRVSNAGVEFFTNSQSTKAKHLHAKPYAAIAVYMRKLARQLRARGPVKELPHARVAAYFATRSRASQLAAWASRQSRALADMTELDDQVKAMTDRFHGNKEIPLPDHWSGYLLEPLHLEFWQEGANRVHERIVYDRDAVDRPWQNERLYP